MIHVAQIEEPIARDNPTASLLESYYVYDKQAFKGIDGLGKLCRYIGEGVLHCCRGDSIDLVVKPD